MPPKLIYDDDCTFCTWAATFAIRRSDIVPVRLSQVEDERSRLTDEERDRLSEGYEESAHLLTDDAMYSGGAAMEQSLLLAGALPESVVALLRRFETYERAREAIYRRISNNRASLANVLSREPPVAEHVSEERIAHEPAARRQ